MSMSLRLRGLIARLKHRAAYTSVEIETQFGPATSRPEQHAKTASRPSRRREPSRFSQETRLPHGSSAEAWVP
jgi:hypothetical protein